MPNYDETWHEHTFVKKIQGSSNEGPHHLTKRENCEIAKIQPAYMHVITALLKLVSCYEMFLGWASCLMFSEKTNGHIDWKGCLKFKICYWKRVKNYEHVSINAVCTNQQKFWSFTDWLILWRGGFTTKKGKNGDQN